MNNVDRFRFFLKVAAYEPVQDDMYASGSAQRHVDNQMARAFSRKNLGTAAAGAAGAAAAYKLSKPFSDARIPLGQQKLRGAAMLGAGLYAAKKARDYLSAPPPNNGAV